jgi:transcriptional regulator with XRE-family HTH domain
MKQLGEVIKMLRLDAGMTQAQLGEKIGTDATNVGRVERGIQNLSLGRLAQIAAVFGVSSADLFCMTKDVNTVAEARMIPVVGWHRWESWNKMTDCDVLPDEQLDRGESDSYIAYATSQPGAFCSKVVGDGLRPRIKPGEYIVWAPAADIGPGDEVGIRLKNGQRLIGGVVSRRGGTITLLPLNEDGGLTSVEESDIERMALVEGIVSARAAIRARSLSHRDEKVSA